MAGRQVTRYGVAEIIGHEAIVPYRYKDSVGVDTDGIGNTAAAGTSDPAKRPYGVEIPMTEVISTFRKNLTKFERRVNNAVTVEVEPHEFDALCSFDYNTGKINSATLTKRLNEGDRESVLAEFDRWHIPPEIIDRRNREKRLFASGKYAHNGMANVYPADNLGRVQWSKGKRINVLPLVDELMLANHEDQRATNNRNGATATGVGTTTTGGASIDMNSVPWENGLRIAAIVLLVITAVFVMRWFTAKVRAKTAESTAAEQLEASLRDAPIIEGKPNK